jgi:hypothetical protein
MKRIIAASLVITAALFAVAGCSNDGSTTEQVDRPVTEDSPASPHSETAESTQILPHSDEREIERSELEGMDNWELTLARNEIFARHGRPFENPDIREHFQGMPWYSPDPDYDKAWLSQLEQDNAEKILEYQDLTYEIPATHP